MSSDLQEFYFFSLLYRIPLVNSAINIGSNVYDNLKTMNTYVMTTLTTTEQLMVYIANTPSVLKMAQKLEKPLAIVDTFACDSLQMLEHRYPSIRMAPEDFKEEAVNRVMVLKGMGIEKLDQIKHSICRQRKQGMDRALLLLDAMISNRVSVYVDIIEKTVDDYLPPIEDRTDDPIFATNDHMFTRLSVIPYKVQERLAQRYNQLVFKITWNED